MNRPSTENGTVVRGNTTMPAANGKYPGLTARRVRPNLEPWSLLSI